jgi:hypothetical protein
MFKLDYNITYFHHERKKKKKRITPYAEKVRKNVTQYSL